VKCSIKHWQGDEEEPDEETPSSLIGLKQGNIHQVRAAARPALEFYGMTLNMNRTNPNIFRMPMKTSLKTEQIIVHAFGLFRWLRGELMKGHTVTHPAIRTDHPNNFRWGDEFHVEGQRVHGEALLKKCSTFIHAHTTIPSERP
jgi:hypothetical protein